MFLLYLSVGIFWFLLLNSSHVHSRDGNSQKSCKQDLKLLADSISNFTHCAVTEASPFKFCRLCYKQFAQVRYIRSIIYDPDNGCVEEYVESERYQIVNHVYEFAKSLWEGSNCYNCFQGHHEDQDSLDINWLLKPVIVEFFQKQELVNQCFKNYSKMNKIPYVHVGNETKNISMSNVTNTHLVCSRCRTYYDNLNSVYAEIVKSLGGYALEYTMCTDAASAMNNTRQRWSHTFNCITVRKDTVAVVALTCFFCSLPIIFYSAAKLHGDSDDKKQRYNVIPHINYDSE